VTLNQRFETATNVKSISDNYARIGRTSIFLCVSRQLQSIISHNVAHYRAFNDLSHSRWPFFARSGGIYRKSRNGVRARCLAGNYYRLKLASALPAAGTSSAISSASSRCDVIGVPGDNLYALLLTPIPLSALPRFPRGLLRQRWFVAAYFFISHVLNSEVQPLRQNPELRISICLSARETGNCRNIPPSRTKLVNIFYADWVRAGHESNSLW